jgi:hypothetical protein
MHDTAFSVGRLAMERYCDLPTAEILEIGSYNVNGTLRDCAHARTRYTGLDFEEGPGVDIVIVPGQEWPVKDDRFDLVMASSVLEHDPLFWMTFLTMCGKARAGGYIYLNVPSNGSFHRYPQDYWRFYPDSGGALERWAQSQAVDVRLVESFITRRAGDQWNDFVAIFRKSGPVGSLPEHFVHPDIPCFNVKTWQSDDILNPAAETEDMTLLAETRRTVEEMGAEIKILRQQARLEQIDHMIDKLGIIVDRLINRLPESAG